MARNSTARVSQDAMRWCAWGIALGLALLWPMSSAQAQSISQMANIDPEYEYGRGGGTTPPPAKYGHVDGVTLINGSAELRGWACQAGRTESIDVHLYIGGPAGIGAFVVGTKANLYSEAAVGAACGLTGAWYRYAIPLFDNVRVPYPGQPVYVYGISPVGSPLLLGNSGNVFVPPTGSLTAAPANCMIPWGATTCTATVSWTSGAAGAEVWVTDLAGNGATLFARASSGNTAAPWIVASGTRFHLKSGGSLGFASLTLATVDVRGTPTVNQTPTVSLTAPGNGQQITTGSAVALSATARDGDDGVARVEFLVDGVKVGEDTGAPYTSTWTTTAGAHILVARAFDTRGAQTTSANVTVTVAAPPSPKSVTRRFVYDAYQQLCRTIEPETGNTFLGYDGAGNLAWSAGGWVTTEVTGCALPEWTTDRRVDRTYDTRNRVATLRFPDGRGNQTWTWTADGLPATITTWNAPGEAPVINRYDYNKRRLLTGESIEQAGHTATLGYGYDANGYSTRYVTPDDLQLTSVVNALGQPTRVSSQWGTVFASGARYYPNGALKQFTYGNGLVHTLTQNARQLPDTSTDAYGGTAVLSDSYDYDANGNVAAITDGAAGRNQRGNRTMAYDGLDRLTAVSSPMFTAAQYRYDALDNLTRVAIGGIAGRDHYYCYDGANRLTNVRAGGCTAGASVIGLGYDAQGNVVNKNGHAYDFDYGNRLRAAAGKEAYRYDGHGRRVAAFAPAAIWSTYSQSGRLIYQRDERRNLQIPHVYLGDTLVATVEWNYATDSGQVKFQHTDALGTPVATTDINRNVIERSEYEPYGKVLNRPVKDGVAYTGHVADAQTGLVYMQQRYYDPTCGCFLSTDAETADGNGDMRFLNRYAYAFNNPYRFTDPDGRCPSCIGAGVGAGLETLVQGVEIGFGLREEFSGRDILISGAAGATGVGLGRLIARGASLGKLVQFGLNRASDAATSAGSQLAKDGEVSLKDTLIDVATGGVVGEAAAAKAGSTAAHSEMGRILERQANRAERVAAGSQRAGRQEAAASARAAQQEHVNGAAAAAAVSASNAASSAEAIRCTAGGGSDC